MNDSIKEKVETELNKLMFYQQLCKEALNDFSENNPYQLTKQEKEKIELLLKRLFSSEIDYLNASPENYFDLYEDE